MPLHEDGHVYRSRPSALKNIPWWRRRKASRYQAVVADVVDRGRRLRELDDAALRQRGEACREQACNGKHLDLLLGEMFALVREASRRTLGMEHFPVQILGGVALHRGHIVEMATGEGKTLTATLAAALNAISDRGVHIVTVNDYLAQRDAEEMGPIYRFFGLTVGAVVHEHDAARRRLAYRANITYATNKELGFDFLRDELAGKGAPWFSFGKQARDLAGTALLRPNLHFAIVDEADSILIDEARTPLILAGSPPVDAEIAHEFRLADQVAPQLTEERDFTFDRKEKKIEWLREGEDRVSRLVGHQRSLSGHRIDWHESCLRALKAHLLFHRDVEYVVEEGEVVIVDEFTGRKMPGRQWEEGLHQAVACKEGLELKARTETLARTTYQIFFNRYAKLAGMTGTAMTDAQELAEIYGRGTLTIPTNRPCLRQTSPDLIFGTETEKWDAVVQAVGEAVRRHRPVLVGTRSIDKSELLSDRLRTVGLPHVVLNARHEAQEAKIVAEAGRPGRVTVATNMAGRGTDIKITPEVSEAGGLLVIGTERHESRRIDLQLIGRCARQGDPGASKFFVSLEDPLFQRYRPKQSARLVARYRNHNGPIDSPRLRAFFQQMQQSIERLHRKTRNQLLGYERERAKNNRQIGVE